MFLKKWLTILTTSLGILLFLITLIALYDEQNIRIKNCPHYTNKIIDCGLSPNQKTFNIQLNNFNRKIELYRVFKNYKDLNNNLKIGDNITIYFKDTLASDGLLQVYYIEKDNSIILDKSEFQNRYRIIILVIALACIYLIFEMFFYIKNGYTNFLKNTLINTINILS